MPSLSGLLNRSKTKKENGPKIDASGLGDSSVASQDANVNEKIQRRQSKREVFKNWLHKANPRTSAKSAKRGSGIQSTIVQTPGRSSPEKPTSPMSDPNKPLPPPPPPGSQDEEKENPRSAPVKLNRILSPLSVPDIHRLFSGAPQFFCRSEGAMAGAPWPSVAFPWNIELEIRDLSDHGQIEDQAWGCITAAQHITRDVRKNPDANKEHARKKRGHFRPRCFERPNMISYQGLERGTMGYSAALQMGVADALLEEEEPVGQEPLVGRRHNFLNDKNVGIRMLDELDVASRLAELGVLYNENTTIHQKTNVEMYSELFTKVLFPPTRVTDSNDPYSLHVQIEALLKVLAVEHIWIDFSIVEWRIRLGQILWGPPYEPSVDDDISINGELLQEPGQQRYWLLLQILLSCELLIRLDIITKSAETNPKIISAQEVHEFDKQATTSVRWSMILARRWLENIKITLPSIPSSPDKKPATGWLESLTGLGHSKGNAESDELRPITFTGMHQTRQFQGLIHFAKKIDWPRIDIIAEKVSQALLNEDGVATTPAVGTPLSMTSQRASYFGSSSAKRPGLRRGLSRQNRMSALVHPSGWLSQSYLTGLILPGEGLGHFLVSTLLENDSTAVAALGEEANLYGGFLYSGKSFWSTSCVIGRILAAGKGASECIGWLSTDVIPNGIKDGWVNVDVEVAPQDVDNTPATSRIWKKSTIERDSHVLGTAASDPSSLFPGDFALPLSDAPSESPLQVSLLSLDLFTTISSSSSASPSFEIPPQITPLDMPTPIKTYSANMRFKVSGASMSTGLSGGGTERELDLECKYDVHFVTAHPCVPSKHIELLSSEMRLNSIVSINNVATRGPGGPHEEYIGHPLHKSYAFTRHHLSTLLLPHDSSSGMPNPLASLHTGSKEIFIIDCTEPSPSGPTSQSSISPAVAAFSTAPTSPTKATTPNNTSSVPTSPSVPLSPALPPHMYSLALSTSNTTGNTSTTGTSGSTTSLLSTNADGKSNPLPKEVMFGGRRKRFGSDLEMLARAWCAEKGLNALISRRGRNCLACSVREAGGLGWKVVLRFG